MIHKTLPPVVTDAVVMLIDFNLAPVVTSIYWLQDPWLAFIAMLIVVALNMGLRDFLGRIAIFPSLVTGYILNWVFDLALGSTRSAAADDTVTKKMRVDWPAVKAANWFSLPSVTNPANWRSGDAGNIVGFRLPQFSLGTIIIVLPAAIALIAESVGHVEAVTEMTGEDLDPLVGRAVAADGGGSMLATLVGAGPTTTYARNIGVMAAIYACSAAAYVVASLMAICFGLSPKFGAVIPATPSTVLGGICVVLYGIIGLLGAETWKENHVDFGNPINLVPAAVGIITGIGDVKLLITEGFILGGIALGTIVTVAVYRAIRAIAPRGLREAADGTPLIYDASGIYSDDMSDAATVDNRPASRQ